MVDASFGEKPDLVQRFSDKLLLAPVDVPIIVIGLPVNACGQTLLDAVGEVRLEFDFAAA